MAATVATVAMEEDPLYKLEYLSLVSKIATEVENHLGINDRVLAEFVIALQEQSPTCKAFQAKLEESGAEFSDGFAESLWRLITTLHPKHKKAAAADAQSAPPRADADLSLIHI